MSSNLSRLIFSCNILSKLLKHVTIFHDNVQSVRYIGSLSLTYYTPALQTIVHGLTYKLLPWNVEKNGLKEECKTDPLVVFMVSHLLVFAQLGVRRNAGVRAVIAVDTDHA